MKIDISEKAEFNIATKMAEELNISVLLANLLIKRGISSVKQGNDFLYATYSDLSSPFVYTGMQDAVTLINNHIDCGNRILVYGDYDCDGVCAVSILLRAFRGKNINVDYYIPVRQEEGYGLNSDAINKIYKTKKPDLLITVDCGISSYKEVELAKSFGMDVVVTDHHSVCDKIPDCIVVDPVFNADKTPLCGAGVAFTLVRALFGEEYAKEFVDICALATVADIVPLMEDNRILVKAGIEKIRSGKAKIGINELVYSAQLDKKIINSYDFGFKLAPRLNASGRLNIANSSVSLLTTEDITEARFLAEELSIQNKERQDIGKKIFEEGMLLAEGFDFEKNKIIVLKSDTWNEGVIGIACAKIAEFFYRPTILLTKSNDGNLKGSARSINGVNIFDLISTQSKYLLGFGGHSMAAGLSLSEENFDKFFDGINDASREIPNEIFKRKVVCDEFLKIDNINSSIFRELDLLEPFGFKNPAPIFCDDNPNVAFSRIGISNHAKSKTKSCEIVCFSKWKQICAYENASERELLYSLSKNYFNGNVYNQISVKKMYYRDFSVNNNLLATNFALFSNECKKITQKSIIPCGNGATLHVFFGESDFLRYISDNKDVKQVYYDCEEFEFCDTAVLSPCLSYPFGYYGQVFVHGKVTDSIKTFFDMYGAKYIDINNEYGFFENFSLDEMRKVYLLLRNFANFKFNGFEDIYKRAKQVGNNLDFENFTIYLCILSDVELIKIDGSGILIVTNSKTDIAKSPIYRYIYG